MLLVLTFHVIEIEIFEQFCFFLHFFEAKLTGYFCFIDFLKDIDDDFFYTKANN